MIIRRFFFKTIAVCLNRAYTRCADGSWQEACYVAEIDWQATGLLPEQIDSVRNASTAVLLRADHPATRTRWVMDEWLAWPHVLVRTDDAVPSLVDRALAPLGLGRRVGLVVNDLLLVPHVVARTDLLFTGPAQVLRPLCEPLGLTLLPPPTAIPEVAVGAMWQERLHADPGHRWFRQRVVDVLSRHLPRQLTVP